MPLRMHGSRKTACKTWSLLGNLGPGDQTQVARLSCKCLYPDWALSHRPNAAILSSFPLKKPVNLKHALEASI